MKTFLNMYNWKTSLKYLELCIFSLTGCSKIKTATIFFSTTNLQSNQQDSVLALKSQYTLRTQLFYNSVSLAIIHLLHNLDYSQIPFNIKLS